MRFDAEKRPFYFGIAISLVVHIAAILAFTLFDTGNGYADGARLRSYYLCHGGRIRCGFPEERPLMRNLALSLSGAPSVIEAMVIPRLGLAAPVEGQMPRLLKYEQPEKIQDAVNIQRDNQDPKDVRNKSNEKKKAELDKKKSMLDQLLGAPEDDDPRKRATALDRIVGSAEGSVYGTGDKATAGSIYGGKVALALKKEFVVPSSIAPTELATLKVRVSIRRISGTGEILEYRIDSRSGNAAFDAACEVLVRKFAPRDGGKLTLPQPDPAALGYVNAYGMVLDLDGALFHE
jgi:hypothetical protein